VTEDELEEIVLGDGEVGAVAGAFSGLDEKQRKKLSTPAKQLYKQLIANKPSDAASPRLKAFVSARSGDPWTFYSTPAARKAVLALFAVCPVSALRSNRLFVGYYDNREIEKILVDRRPDWLDDWIAYQLGQQFGILQFPMLRGWIKAGLCRKPDHERYYEMFAGHLMRTMEFEGNERLPAPPISQQLLDDPELLDDVWGLFRVETIAFNTNSWISAHAAGEYESWPQALLKLSQAGKLDRARLLDASLDGLTHDVKQNQLSGVHKFHRALDPTPDEMRDRQSAYLSLLCHRTGHVAKFALDMAAKLHQMGALDCETFFREAPAIFLQPVKGNTIAALKLAGRVLKKRPEMLEQALSLIQEALRSDSVEVQILALDLIETHLSRLSSAQLAELSSQDQFILPAARTRFDNVLKISPNSAAGGNENADAAASLIGKAYTPARSGFGELPILPTVEPLAPITTLDELISVVSHAVEHVDSAGEIERIIDGISCLCGERPRDFDARVAPLRHRLQQSGGTSHRGLMSGWNEGALALIDLVRSWLSGKLVLTSPSPYTRSAIDAFVPMQTLLRAVAQRVVHGRGQQLLSAPTHHNGWIDPQIWIDRLIEAERSGCAIEPLDLSYSLLRLAPDERVDARERTVELSGWLGRIASFALGGDDKPMAEDKRYHAVWISAARARDPAADWSAFLAPLNLEDAWPDSVRPAAYTWRAFTEARKNGAAEWKEQRFILERKLADPLPEAQPQEMRRGLPALLSGSVQVQWKDVPTAALCHTSKGEQRWMYDYSSIWVSQWLSHLWPQNGAPAFAAAADRLALRLDADASNLEPSAGYLECLFQKNRAWGEMGHLALLFGLAGKDADARGLAIDALVQGIEGSQFDPALFAPVLVKFAQSGWMKPARVAQSLQQAARVSPWHALAISEALQRALPGLDMRAPNMFAIVELLLECQLTIGRPLKTDAAAALGELNGEGKLVKAARQLLTLTAHSKPT
jgi:hypothetical protein